MKKMFWRLSKNECDFFLTFNANHFMFYFIINLIKLVLDVLLKGVLKCNSLFM